jgi:hypothetical protein
MGVKKLGMAMTLAAGLGFAGAANAIFVSYADDKAGFLAATEATSIGALPASGGSGTVVGDVTFTYAGSFGYLGFNNVSIEIAGNNLGVGGVEEFDMAIAGGAHALGFDLHEPAYNNMGNFSNLGCNAGLGCVDSPFSIELFSGNSSLGTFVYNAPDDLSANVGGPVGFFGIHSSELFDRIEVRDLSDNLDNEYFGNFLTGSTALVDSGTPPMSVPEPATLALLGIGLVGLGFAKRKHA